MTGPPGFAVLLDPDVGGHVAAAPTGPLEVDRPYLQGTNVLRTTFRMRRACSG